MERPDHRPDLTGAPACWMCRHPADVAWWTAVIHRGARVYRPLCSSCCPVDVTDRATTTCAVCGWATGYATPAPPGKGQWIEDLDDVCSISCLNAIKRTLTFRRPPPAPRPCAWCSEEFQPRTHDRARYCSRKCRQAGARRPPTDDQVAELLQLHDHLPAHADRTAADLLEPRHRTP